MAKHQHKRPEWPAGLKKTKPRQQVLSILEEAHRPLSAKAIYAEIEQMDGSAWLSTVYRTLELFVNEGLATKVNVLDSELTLYELNHSDHQHYAVCVECHKIIPMLDCPLERFTPDIQDEGFRPLGHNLEVYGTCGSCSALS